MKLRIVFFLTLLILSFFPVWAQTSLETDEHSVLASSTETDSLHVSLLTCSPGPEVYALYGHTAIRLTNSNTGEDMVYNYGSFNMSEPNFILKFMLGWLDYELGLSSFQQFLAHYSYDGCDITQQELNLTSVEKARMLQILTENRKPENRGYRYNFLYDNCSTRPRDIIESVVDGKLVWQEENVSSTYRGLLHECNSPWPWSSLGVDLVLGQAADEQITQREQEFLPVYLQHHLDAAKIQDLDGNVRPAIANTIVFPAIAIMDDSAEFFLSPMQCILLLLLFVLLLSVLEFKRHTLYWGVDVLLLSAQGIAGILITILFFFSEHPTVNSNWLLWVFNPIPLLYVPVMIYQRIKQHKDPFQIFQAGWLFLFVVFSAFIPQELPSEAIWAAVVLLVRSISHLSHDYLVQTKRVHNER